MKYTSFYLSGFLAFVLCINPAVVAHADDDDRSQTLQISAAEPDLDQRTLLITGTNFSRGTTFNGTVELFFPPENGPTFLTVISFDSVSPQMILVESPAGIEDFPGTYLLRVNTRENNNSKSWGLVADFDVTFGAVGPQGIEGIQGDQGIQGIQGIDGIKGDKGDQGDIGPQGPEGPPGARWRARRSGSNRSYGGAELPDQQHSGGYQCVG